MLEIDEALSIVLSQAHPLPATRVDLRSAHFRTLAVPVSTDIDQPPFDRSLMDGYAISAEDSVGAPVPLKVSGQIAAGQVPNVCVQPGHAVQINTGAAIPEGADAVVRIEDTRFSDDGATVEILQSVNKGQFITPRAQYRAAGAIVLPRGAILSPVNVGVAAAAGASSVDVFRQPCVAVVATGNELVDVGVRPTGAQIRNSNEYQLEALIRSVHCGPVVFGSVGDDRDAIHEALVQASKCDVICLTGGVSMGAFDLVPEVLGEFGATCHFHKISIKPGRPILFATLPHGQLVFALPGNPVSALVGFFLLVAPALAALQGRQESRQMRKAVLRGNLREEGRRRAYYPASLDISPDGGYEVRLLSWHGSGDMVGMAGAQALIMRPPGSPPAGDGEAVEFLPLA